MELRILTWLFPWLVAVREFLLRATAETPDAWEFIGPTVGGAALGMMLPFTRIKFVKDGEAGSTFISIDLRDDHRD